MDSSLEVEEGSRASRFGSLGGGELGIKPGVWTSEMGSSIGSDLTRISSLGRRKLVEGREEDVGRGSGRRLRSWNGTSEPIFWKVGFEAKPKWKVGFQIIG